MYQNTDSKHITVLIAETIYYIALRRACDARSPNELYILFDIKYPRN